MSSSGETSPPNTRALSTAGGVVAVLVLLVILLLSGAINWPTAVAVGVMVGGLGAFFYFQPLGAARPGFWMSMLLPAGLASLLVAELMVLEEGVGQTVFRITAALLIVAYAGWRGYEIRRSTGEMRKAEIRLIAATGGVIVALVLYFLSTDAGLEWMGMEEEAAERAGGALGALWVALMIPSLLAILFMEVSYRAMPVEEAVEVRRVHSGMLNGLTLGMSIIFVFSMIFVAQKREYRRDFSYFRTSMPSETTTRRVSTLTEPVRAVLLFPRVNEVLDQVRPYFEELDGASENFSVEIQDHALAPQLAEQHRIRGNGYVLLVRGEGEGAQGETIEIGTTLEEARSRLRTLDGRFQRVFSSLTLRPREIYFTAGHRERSAQGAEGDDRRMRLSMLDNVLEQNNVSSRPLGLAQGLGNQVPEGAPAVAVVGPRTALLPEEANSLLRYVREGGRLIVMVDPDADHGLDPLLRGLGLGLREGVLNSNTNHLRVRGLPPGADRAVIFSNEFTSHPTVSQANRNRRQFAALFERAGALARQEEGETPGITVRFTIRTGAGYWLDVDEDHEQDSGETSEPRFNLAAAVTVPNEGGEEGRAVVIADGDFITDTWIPNNVAVLADVLNWLLGEEEVFGPTTTEEDQPIRQTEEEHKAIFWATTVGAPTPLILIGGWMALRRRRRGGNCRRVVRSRGKAEPDEEEEDVDSDEVDDEDDDDDEEDDEDASEDSEEEAEDASEDEEE